VIYFKAPHSFTCEDVVEFQCHGGMISSSKIIDACLEEGAILAKAGEFTKRAVLNGRIDLTRAEAAAKLIESKSEDAARILSRQLTGELQRFVDDLRDKLIEIVAYVEVNIDYAEEDLPKDLQKQIEEKLITIRDILDTTLEGSKSREGLIDGFKVSLIGKPNVGKSSLLNALLRYDRAIISEVAGTTRDTVEESLKIGTHLVKFVDTAGIREADEIVEKIGIKKSLLAIESSDIVIALFDGSLEKDFNDEKIVKLLKEFNSSKEIIVVINKSDLVQEFNTKEIEIFSPLTLSCKESVEILIERLATLLNQKSSADDLILISKRQVDAVCNSLKFINDSFAFLKSGELEIFSYNLNEAIYHISSITKVFERDEILDKMFGSFCLGK